LSTNVKNFHSKHRGKVIGILLCIYGLTGGVFAAIYEYIFQENVVAYIFFQACFCSAAPIAGIIFLNVVPQKKEPEIIAANEETRLVTPEAGSDSVNGDDEVETITKPVVSEQDGVSTFRMLLTIDFWLLSLCVFCSMGSSITLLSNLGGVVESYGGARSATAVLMMIYSVASSTGRIVMGLLSDRLSFFMTRMTFLNCCFLSIGACLFTCIFAITPMFYPLMFIFGISYGGMMASTPTLISDRWGTRYFATNLAAVFLFQLLGSYC
jgi:MFS family permease